MWSIELAVVLSACVPGALIVLLALAAAGCSGSADPAELDALGSAPRGDQNLVCWMGTVIDCVDFTRPEALGAPA